MFHRLVFLIFISLSFFSHAAFAQSAYTKRAFTIKDSIKMVQIIEPRAAYSTFSSAKIKMSPDGKYFVIVIRSGNPDSGKNDYSLLLYQSKHILSFLNEDDKTTSKSKSMLPKGEILVHVSTSLNESAFQEITWLGDSKTLAFIGWFDAEKGQTPGQVYRFDIRSKTMNKLTNHPRSITGYAFNIASQKIVFASTVSKHNTDRTKTSYLVGVRPMTSISDPDSESPVAANHFYIQNLGRPGHSQAVGRVYNSAVWEPLMSLSPDGRRVIVLTTQKDIPIRWREGYNYLKNPGFKNIHESFDDNYMIPQEGLILQFSLIDLMTEEIRPVFDAPTGFIPGGVNIAAHWLPNSNSVILANTSLPLDVSDKQERKRRSHLFSTVEYNVNTRIISLITNHTVEKYYRNPDTLVTSDAQFWALNISPTGLLEIKEKNEGEDNLRTKLFKKENSKWVQMPTRKTIHKNRLNISIHQDLNTPPEIMALDISTGRKKVITDLNPQFRNLTFGKTQVLNWKDSDGRALQAGLVYPPDFMEGHKYPLVIQTHGFDPHEFLIDGPYGTASAFAAQALANKGMMVLQMKSPPVAQNHNSLSIFQLGFESAIDNLATMNLIDREKVGLIGWSATSTPILHMLLYSDYSIAASTLADSYNIGIGPYSTWFGTMPPGMKFVEKMTDGAVPWGQSLEKWIINDPTFHLNRLKTPLRLEQYITPPSLWWGTYTILKRQHKPVEFYVFNDAPHELVKPEHRIASQGGNVDWFAFWLKGEEDTDPTKVDQYKRWRELRIQQKKSRNSAILARMRDANPKN